MFKALILRALRNLSNDQIEDQVRDRLSFMGFLPWTAGPRRCAEEPQHPRGQQNNQEQAGA